MTEEPNGGGHRRSARISALEEKARSLALERKAKAALIGDAYGNNFQAVPKRRGRKRKSLHDMVVKSEEEFENDENAWNQSVQEMPNKVVLEFILDLIMQRKDAKDVFAEPSGPDQENVKDSKDFGTIRAKIREGMYTSLAQFERDVNLITKNPMNFSSALSVFSSEARTISELADRLFSSLRTEPEKFPSEDAQTRNNGKKPLGEDGSASVKNAKPKNGIHINNPSPKKRNYFASSSLNPNPSGSRQGGKSNFVDKRATYKPESFSNNKNDSLFSLELNEPKILELVPTSDSAYIKSFLSFLRGMGPTVKSFGSKKLTKTLSEASLLQQWNPSTPLTKTSDPKTQRFNSVGSVKPYTYLRGARVGPSIQEPSYPRGGNVGSLPHNSIFNPQGSYKGKAVAVEDGMNAFNIYGGGMSSVNSCLPWERPQANNGGSSNSFFLGENDVDTSKNMSSFGSDFNEQTTENDESTHLLFATLLQDNSPNMHTSSESSYLPPNGPDQFPNVLPSKIVLPSPSSTHKNYAGSMSFSIQSSNNPSPSSKPRNYAGSESMNFPVLSSNIPSPSSTPNSYAGSMSFPIQSSNTPSPSSTPNNYAASMSFPIQSPNTTTPGIDTLYAKGKTPMIPATTPSGLDYKHPQPSSSRNAAAMETPWYETVNAPSEFGFNFMNPFGEGSSTTPAFSKDRYGSKSSKDIQSAERNQDASWSLQPTFDPPNLPAPQVINQNPPPRYSFMQLLQGIPQEQDFLDETSFLEEADPPRHQALSNTQSFWNTPPSVPIDLELTEQPDLNLQL